MNTFLSEADLALKGQYELFVREHLIAAQSEERFKIIARHGYLDISLTNEYQFLHLVLFVETLSAVDPSLAVAVSHHYTASELINRYGNIAQKSHYLPLLARAELIATVAHLDPEADEGITRIKVVSGENFIEGEKKLVVNGQIAQLIIVLAQEEMKEENLIPSFWLLNIPPVPPVQDNAAKTIEIKPRRFYLGLHSVPLNDIEFHGLIVTSEQKLHEASSDYPLSIIRTLIGAVSLGMMERTVREAADFAKDHKRNGEVLGHSQSVQWKLADLSTDITAAKLFVYRAAWSKDEEANEFAKYSIMAKSLATKAARVHSAAALDILGLMEGTQDSVLASFYNDAKMLEGLEGMNNDDEKLLLAKLLDV